MRIAQISDTHISAEAPDRIADLERCVAQINALDPLPDIVIHTGDVVHDGLPAQYEIARERLNALTVPWFVMVGNKDNRAELMTAFSPGNCPRPNTAFIQYAVDAFPIRLVCLDTLCEGTNKGELCATRLGDLDAMLRADPDKPTVVFMHHPPFDVPVAPDPFQFAERASADACLKILSQNSNVRGLLCGHVHRPFTTQIDAYPARVMTAVARELRFGEAERAPECQPLYTLHEFDSPK